MRKKYKKGSVSRQEELVVLAVNDLLGVQIELIHALLGELKKLNEKQIRLIWVNTFPITKERKKNLKVIPEKSLTKIERIIEIYKIIGEARKEGRYEMLEHFSSTGVGLALMTDEEMQIEIDKIKQFRVDKTKKK